MPDSELPLLFESATIRDCLHSFEQKKIGVVFIVDHNEKFIGLISEGDVRRLLLGGLSLDMQIVQHLTREPSVLTPPFLLVNANVLFSKPGVTVIPLLNIENKVTGFITKADFLGSFINNTADKLLSGYRSPDSELEVVARKWGFYFSVYKSINCHAKVLHILPGKAISLQYHHRREEHWIIMNGVAKITIGSIERTASSGDYAFIPKQEIHKLENIGGETLLVHELQRGDYFGEDDIVRLGD